MPVREELAAAVGCLTALARARAGVPREALAAGLVFYPVVGLLLGGASALAARAVSDRGPLVAAVASVLTLEVLTAGRPRHALAVAAGALSRRGDAAAVLERLRSVPGPRGVAAAAVALGLKVWSVAAIPPAGRATALCLAPMLGRWAMVVLCYGGTPQNARGPAAAQLGRARFREFGGASLVALGVTLSVADGVGLVLVLVAAVVTVLARVHLHRRLGGLTGRLVSAVGELVETVVLLALGVLARIVVSSA